MNKDYIEGFSQGLCETRCNDKDSWGVDGGCNVAAGDEVCDLEGEEGDPSYCKSDGEDGGDGTCAPRTCVILDADSGGEHGLSINQCDGDLVMIGDGTTEIGSLGGWQDVRKYDSPCCACPDIDNADGNVVWTQDEGCHATRCETGYDLSGDGKTCSLISVSPSSDASPPSPVRDRGLEPAATPPALERDGDGDLNNYYIGGAILGAIAVVGGLGFWFYVSNQQDETSLAPAAQSQASSPATPVPSAPAQSQAPSPATPVPSAPNPQSTPPLAQVRPKS